MGKEKQKRTRIVAVRLTEAEVQQFEKNLQGVTGKSISSYLRKLILGKPVQTLYRNQSMDELMAELALLRQELNRIGVNFNQSVKKLHTLSSTEDFRRWVMANEIEKRTLSNKIDEIKSHILKIVQSWLQ